MSRGAPSHRIKEGLETHGIIASGDFWQAGPVENASAWLQLPDDLKLFPKRIFIHGNETDQTLSRGGE